jgi:hypothetical protein
MAANRVEHQKTLALLNFFRFFFFLFWQCFVIKIAYQCRWMFHCQLWTWYEKKNAVDEIKDGLFCLNNEGENEEGSKEVQTSFM